MPLTKATQNVISPNICTTDTAQTITGVKTISNDTLINGINAGRGSGNFDTNTVFGRDALNSNTTGINNTALGLNALDANTIGYSNVAVGVQALDANVDGYQNTAVGLSTLFANVDGANNTAVGTYALSLNETGNNNVAVGLSALDSNIGGSNNVAVGRDALDANVNGNDNIAVGFGAGATSTGSDNVFIGRSAAGSTTSISNQVNIYNGSVTARFTGAAIAWTFTSDERDKKNIEDLNIGLDFINQLKARKFAWEMRNSDVDKGKEASGFISQEVLQVVNDNNAAYTGLVDTSNPEQYTLAATNLIPILVKAVQELSAEVAALKAK